MIILTLAAACLPHLSREELCNSYTNLFVLFPCIPCSKRSYAHSRRPLPTLIMIATQVTSNSIPLLTRKHSNATMVFHRRDFSPSDTVEALAYCLHISRLAQPWVAV